MSWGLRGVTVLRGGRVTLDEVTLEVAPGTVTVIVGGDGAGKTTSCRALVGLDPVATGEVARPDPTCYQPETSGVWSDLTVNENLGFVSDAYRLGPETKRRRIDALLEVTGLGPARRRLARHLSGGMRQKLGVAMAVLPEPELIVLDEPTTGLDPVSRLDLWALIGRFTGEGKAVVVSTTYTDEALRGDRVLALEAGRPLAEGTVAEVVATMPGAVYQTAGPVGGHSWLRAGSWRTWSRDPLPGGEQVIPDLADVLTVAALAETTGRSPRAAERGAE